VVWRSLSRGAICTSKIMDHAPSWSSGRVIDRCHHKGNITLKAIRREMNVSTVGLADNQRCSAIVRLSASGPITLPFIAKYRITTRVDELAFGLGMPKGASYVPRSITIAVEATPAFSLRGFRAPHKHAQQCACFVP
jgi:hypothetical protein